MSSTTKSVPRFRIGEWVLFPFGTRKVLAKIIEDRGPIGYRGRRLYGVLLDRNRPEPKTTEAPEEDLEAAPKEILTPEAAKERGISTGYWPTHGFDIAYIREGKSSNWAAIMQGGLAHEGVGSRVSVGYTTARYGSESPRDENFANVTIPMEYDPRLRDPRENPVTWHAMLEEAQRLADRWFKTKHPKSVIERD